MHVQFADSKRDRVVAIFSCPQDPDAFPHQGDIEDDDSRYVAFMDSLSESVKRMASQPV